MANKLYDQYLDARSCAEHLLKADMVTYCGRDADLWIEHAKRDFESLAKSMGFTLVPIVKQEGQS